MKQVVGAKRDHSATFGKFCRVRISDQTRSNFITIGISARSVVGVTAELQRSWQEDFSFTFLSPESWLFFCILGNRNPTSYLWSGNVVRENRRFCWIWESPVLFEKKIKLTYMRCNSVRVFFMTRRGNYSFKRRVDFGSTRRFLIFVEDMMYYRT